MAHALHYLVKNKLVKLSDDSDSIDWNKVDLAEVDRMEKENSLGFNPVKVYSLKVEENLFAFVFAKDELEAINFTKNKLNENPSNCIEYMMDVEMEKGNRILSFRDMKKEYQSFPELAGYFEISPFYR